MKEYQPGQKKKKNSLTLQSNISQCVLVLFHLFYLFIGFSKIVNVFFKPASKKKRRQGKLQRFKQKKHLVWRDAQWLGVLTALPEDRGSDPSTYIGWLCDQEL